MCRECLVLWLVVVGGVLESGEALSAKGPSRVLEPGASSSDARLGKVRQLRDKFHPWVPPKTLKAWQSESARVRRQLKVATGLWPAWPRPALKPVIHGLMDRGDYTVEKVYFASLAGHYVTGNLYRPKRSSKGRQGPRPGVLCPHGHWPNGRFYDSGTDAAAVQLKKGAEKFEAGARFPLQARMVHLARMGCVVFHYDMVGYADSGALPHRTGFGDVAATLRLQNLMGLQTYNSMRALDFLEALPDVDPKRIAVTGASGGGTQTFMLCALDERPAVAFPAVMVSTGMQGGCVCENCCFLRTGINNITIAALFAPRPMAMSGADDWTIDIETRGLPELKEVYKLFGKAELVHAKCYPQFGHNYNQVSREMMYAWMNRHLALGLTEPIRERDFQPLSPDALKVFGGDHPQPSDAQSLEQYRASQRAMCERQYAELLASTEKDMLGYRQVVGGAARVLLSGEPSRRYSSKGVDHGSLAGGGRYETGILTCQGKGQAIPWTLLTPRKGPGPSLVAWFDGRGKSALFGEDGRVVPAVRRLLDAGHSVIAADAYLVGELTPGGKPVKQIATDTRFIGYTYGYNLPPVTHRVRDVQAIVTTFSSKMSSKVKQRVRVHLVGTGGAGPWVLLARAAMSTGKAARGQTVVNLEGFGFSKVTKRDDPMLLPGALKYGGLGGLAALAVPSPLVIGGVDKVPDIEWAPLESVYRSSRAPLAAQAAALTFDAIVNRLLDD